MADEISAPASWYHGGAGGLDVGALLLPPVRTGFPGLGSVDRHCRRDRVYVTPSLPEALIYAALRGGDVYQVEPAGAIEREHDLSTACECARIVQVVERDVRIEVAEQAMQDQLEAWLRG